MEVFLLAGLFPRHRVNFELNCLARQHVGQCVDGTQKCAIIQKTVDLPFGFLLNLVEMLSEIDPETIHETLKLSTGRLGA